MRARFFLITMVLATFIAGSSIAEEMAKEIKFPKGSSGTTIDGSVIRGDRDIYYLAAKAGQKMTVSISSIEKNAVFQIYQPGTSITKDQDGIIDLNGKSLPGAGEGDDAMQWKGALPATGKYLIVVGGTRGNTTYKMKIGIAP